MAIERISTNFAGAESDGSASGADLSSSGRYVVYVSDAADIVGGQVGGSAGVYVKDTETGRVQRIDRGVDGAANGAALSARISADGRFIVYTSEASNLVAEGIDDNGSPDVFVYDRQTGETRLVSASGDGTAAGMSDDAVISANGRLVAFRSQAHDIPTGQPWPRRTPTVHPRQVQCFC